MLLGPSHAAVGGRTVWAGGSGDIRFPQRSRGAPLLDMTTILLLFLLGVRAYDATLSERSCHEKPKARSLRSLGNWVYWKTSFFLILLGMEKDWRVAW